MKKFKTFLIESKEHKNVHLNHLEDMVLLDGISGVRNSIDFLRSLRDMLAGNTKSPVNVTTKWVGAPALITGINPENGKFFVGTKGVFANNGKLCYTDSDIDKYYPDSGLNDKLKTALQFLPDLDIKNIIQGDMLFTKGNIKNETINNVDYITFRPNTILYAIPQDSAIAKRMLAAQLGIVFHTTYKGKSIATLKAVFSVDIGRLKPSKHVWFRDATFTDVSGTATFTESETIEITSILSEIGTLFHGLSPGVVNYIAENDTIRTQIMTYNNQKVRSGLAIADTRKHITGLIEWVSDTLNKNILDAKQPDTKRKRTLEKNTLVNFYKTNSSQLQLIFDIQNLMVKAKLMILRKLESVKNIGTFIKTDDGYKVTPAEGFVVISKKSGQALKIVDRLTFSHANFTVTKDWKK